jgi:site-specific DNA recombinase
MSRAPTTARRARCAIYTRKSSEEGLEQGFNSLDAQREACAAFIKSQRHEGWELVRTPYDDGGYSGGTMERPALRRLMEDVGTGKVDIIVVYKVDRLTRSLADFAKIVEVLDARGASFVSITQQFNTTTSMGRLTLNVLLSFAQFEREVTGERIRDKIAASKRKGMWMGGLPPLGYDVQDRKLLINEAEAETVRHIFRRYVELGSVRLLKQDLDASGAVSKPRANAAGRRWGAKPFARGALYLMLQNRIYRGEIVHKDQSYPGEHPPIIETAVWDEVQRRLSEGRSDQINGGRAASPSLLAGLLHDETGERMTPSHAVKKGTRYRYYVSRTLIIGSRAAAPGGRRIPAGDIEALVAERLRGLLSDPASLSDALCSHVSDASMQQRLIDASAKLSERWPDLPPPEQRALLRAVVSRVDILPERVDIQIAPARLAAGLRGDPAALAIDGPAGVLTLSVPARLKRAGIETRLLVEGARASEPDASLVKLMIRAQSLQKILIGGETQSIEDIARREGVTGSYVTRLVRLAYLAPDIVSAILAGRHPPALTAAKLLNDSRLSLDWIQQRQALGFI